MAMIRYKTVPEYIAHMPKEARPMLRQFRSIIKQLAPKAEESMSYGMPYYSYYGRLAYFAGFKDHVSLFVMSAAQRAFPKEQKPYKTGKATLRFEFGKPLPVALIKKLIKVTVTDNEVRHGK